MLKHSHDPDFNFMASLSGDGFLSLLLVRAWCTFKRGANVSDPVATNFLFICSSIKLSCSSVGTVTLKTTPLMFACILVWIEDVGFLLFVFILLCTDISCSYFSTDTQIPLFVRSRVLFLRQIRMMRSGLVSRFVFLNEFIITLLSKKDYVVN